MPMDVLGSQSFSAVPDVLGVPLMLNGGSTPSISAGTLAARPSFGTIGRLYIATDTLQIFRDTGTGWVTLSNPTNVVQELVSTVAAQSGTTTITLANTTPTTSMGTQIWSGIITPKFASSKILVEGTFMVDSGTANREITACLFRGTTCIGVAGVNVATVNRAVPLSFLVPDTPGSIAAQTYTVRVGVSSSATWYVARTGTAYFNGMYANNGISLKELA